MLANAAARLGLQASRGAATAVASAPHVLDWSALTAQLTSDEAKREVSKLKKTVEDVREQLAAQSKVRFNPRRLKWTRPRTADAGCHAAACSRRWPCAKRLVPLQRLPLLRSRPAGVPSSPILAHALGPGAGAHRLRRLSQGAVRGARRGGRL